LFSLWSSRAALGVLILCGTRCPKHGHLKPHLPFSLIRLLSVHHSKTTATATQRQATESIHRTPITPTTECPETDQRVATPVAAVNPLLLAIPAYPIQPMPLLSIPTQARDRPVLHVRIPRESRYCDRSLPRDEPIGNTIGLHGESSRQTCAIRIPTLMDSDTG
jgi:hypothetical protein